MNLVVTMNTFSVIQQKNHSDGRLGSEQQYTNGLKFLSLFILYARRDGKLNFGSCAQFPTQSEDRIF